MVVFVYLLQNHWHHWTSNPTSIPSSSSEFSTLGKSSVNMLPWHLKLDLYRRIPYTVALKHKHQACAAVLNPSSAEPLVWPSPLKFISELNPEAKALLEKALTEANMEREKAILKETVASLPAPLHSDTEADDNASEVNVPSLLPCI